MNAPIWGNFIGYADEDVLAYAALCTNGLFVLGFYHATQAVEKYLKALALSIIDPSGRSHPFPAHERWLRDHDLSRLAKKCSTAFPFYARPEVKEHLARLSEYDRVTRYPWVPQKLANGFTTADIPTINALLIQLRRDIPIRTDDYALGMLVRGHHQSHPENAMAPGWLERYGAALVALRTTIPNVELMIRR